MFYYKIMAADTTSAQFVIWPKLQISSEITANFVVSKQKPQREIL